MEDIKMEVEVGKEVGKESGMEVAQEPTKPTKRMTSTLKDIYANLGFLALVKSGEKINVGSQSFSGKSWMDSFYRARKGESRDRTVEIVRKYVDDGINSLIEYPEFAVRTKTKLREATTGLENLIETYKTDPKIVSQLKVIVEEIDLQIH